MAVSTSRYQLVTFYLGRELYAIEINKVQEVLHRREITRLPKSPSFIEGVIELRDQIIPIINLKERFGITEETERRKRLLILDPLDYHLGFIVDGIANIITVEESQKGLPADFYIEDAIASCIDYLVKSEDRIIIVVAPEHLLTISEEKELQKLNH